LVIAMTNEMAHLEQHHFGKPSRSGYHNKEWAGMMKAVGLIPSDTAAPLWQFKVSSSVNSTAITYTHKGRQFVSIASGLGGGVIPRFAAGQVPTGGSLWTFALMPE
jgi:predicted SprT family Zn-dependent metalloprotease